jgi:intein/homing endonuclease
MAESRLADEISSGVQTIQYQLVTLMTTNGQTPFVSMFMYLDEVPEGRTRDDLALLIAEVFKQRHQGLKNEQGVYVPAAFPKLLYVLDEDNIRKDSKYYYLTELAAKCSAKTMVPDYISAKIMKELKGDVYPCMGCVDGNSVIDYKINDIRYVESFETAWDRLASIFEIKMQPNDRDMYIDLTTKKDTKVSIFDNKENKYVENRCIIRNSQSYWYDITFTNGRYIRVTDNHPFEVENKGVILAEDLNIGDTILRQNVSTTSVSNEPSNVKRNEFAWLYGVAICDSCYKTQVNFAFGIDETDIVINVINAIYAEYGVDCYVKEWHRGIKGNYNELRVRNSSHIRNAFMENFNGVNKSERTIPDFIWNSDYNTQLSFMAGMIDADGYVNNANNTIRVQLGSTNEVLALQQLQLALILGFDAVVYKNHYNSNSDKIRYRIEFNCTENLAKILVSEKKKAHFDKNHTFYANTLTSTDSCTVKNITSYYKETYSYDVTTSSEHFTVNGVYSHNCRSFLTPDRFTENGVGNLANAKNYDVNKHKYYGRFNQGVVTINLVDVALSSGGDMDKFWGIFEERLELCHRALRKRHERLLGTPSDIAPILWQHGAIARLGKGETIDRLLYDGYSTISLGYAGVYEMTKYMTGKSHTDPDGEPFAISVMQYMNDKCTEWKTMENIDYSIYGSPIESTTYKFAKCLQERFGVIPGITDHNYITNSYHRPKNVA